MRSETPAFEPPLPIACVLIPDFPAWAFVRGAPVRRDVVVVERDRVIAATRGARRGGVEDGMSADRARALADGTAVRVRDPQLEAAAWEAATGELLEATPFLESPRPGLAFLGRPDEDSLRAVTARLGAQSARATERNTARLGAARAAAGHLLSVRPSGRSVFLARFGIEGLRALDFGPDFVASLQLFGYNHLAAASTLTKRQLGAQYGDEGERLFGLLHPPAEERPVPPFQPPPTITSSVELEPPCREPGELLPALEHVVREAACSLDTVYARRVAVRIRCGDEEHMAVRILPEAVRSEHVLGRASRVLLMDLLSEEREVDNLCVELGGLGPASLAQAHLFERRPSMHLALRGVNRRFPGAIKRFIIVQALFPEQAVRLEPFVESAA